MSKVLTTMGSIVGAMSLGYVMSDVYYKKTGKELKEVVSVDEYIDEYAINPKNKQMKNK